MKDIYTYSKLLIIKENNMREYISIILVFLGRIVKHNNISEEFEMFIRNLTIYFEN